ncbi:MAG: phosphate permease [Acidobacteria bacterium]|nr:MAG: phosphate permease [Acidobacteriota bacterium]PIE89974.1 MAG: phosphate permease [Acidobacteriota bacterium]
MDIIAQYGPWFLGIAVVFGLYMTWGIGANDVANAMGTSVGSKAITVKQAILIAAIFEFAGVILAGGHVTKTIRKGIIDPTSITSNPEVLVYGMLASLLAAAIWLMIASAKGWPVSTTHSIVGALVGFSLAGIGVDSVKWSKIGTIVVSWVASPLMGGLIAFFLTISIVKLILNTDEPFKSAKRWAPVYLFLVGFIISLVTLFKGLKHLKLELSMPMSVVVSVVFGVIVGGIGKVFIDRIKVDKEGEKKFQYASVEKVFIPLQIVTACAMAFAHGSNDVANGVGPLAAISSIVQSGGQVLQKSDLPIWILLLGAVGIVIGLATMGYRVMATIGKQITELTPTRGFSAELAAATTVVIASRTGIPVSTTHILVGSVMGVGMARGIAALDLRVIAKIVTSWVVTLPVAGILSAFFFYTLRGIFG